MSRDKTTGGCLCGAVRYEITGPLPRAFGLPLRPMPAPPWRAGRLYAGARRPLQDHGWAAISPGSSRRPAFAAASARSADRNCSGSATDSGQLDVVVGTHGRAHRVEDREEHLSRRRRRLLRPAQPMMRLRQPANVRPAGVGGRHGHPLAWPRPPSAPAGIADVPERLALAAGDSRSLALATISCSARPAAIR